MNSIIVEGTALPYQIINDNTINKSYILEKLTNTPTNLASAFREIQTTEQDNYFIIFSNHYDIVLFAPTEEDICNASLISSDLSEQVKIYSISYKVKFLKYPNNDDIVCSLNKIIYNTETEILLEMLNKGLRSHRNRVNAATIDIEAINDAIAPLETMPDTVITTTGWYGKIKYLSNEILEQPNVIISTTKSRSLRRRIFFVAYPVGLFARTISSIEVNDLDSKYIETQCHYKLGIVLYDRNNISCIEI